MHEGTGLRERKKSETRLAISAAALELALEHGPAAVTVEDIATAANVSPRTVFNYFPTKEAAMLGMNPSRRAELVESLLARPAEENPVVALREAYRGLFTTTDVALQWRQRAQLVREHPQLNSTYLAGFSTFEHDLIDAVARRAEVDPTTALYPRLLVAVAGAALRVAVEQALDSGQPASMPDLIDEAFDALAAGLAAPAAPRPR